MKEHKNDLCSLGRDSVLPSLKWINSTCSLRFTIIYGPTFPWRYFLYNVPYSEFPKKIDKFQLMTITTVGITC